MTFDPTTDYANDWQFFDGTELAEFIPNNEGLTEVDARWRLPIGAIVIRPEDVSSAGFASVTVGLASLSPSTTVFCAWNTTDIEFEPKALDVIVQENGDRWIIDNSVRLPFSRWIVAVTRAPTNDT